MLKGVHDVRRYVSTRLLISRLESHLEFLQKSLLSLVSVLQFQVLLFHLIFLKQPREAVSKNSRLENTRCGTLID